VQHEIDAAGGVRPPVISCQVGFYEREPVAGVNAGGADQFAHNVRAIKLADRRSDGVAGRECSSDRVAAKETAAPGDEHGGGRDMGIVSFSHDPTMSRRAGASQGPGRATLRDPQAANVNPMSAENRLGAFLRARRDQLGPEDVDIPTNGRRRAPGLRRDELADLAGVSVDYYVRLERGRDRHPSDQVLDALARALRLDDDGRQHLYELARPPIITPPEPVIAVPAGAAHIVENWHGPATVGDYTGLVIAANELAQALSPAHLPGVNGYRTLFLDPAMRALYSDTWDDVATDVVAALHTAVGSTPDDPRLIGLVGELSIASETFRTLWVRYDVGPRPGAGVTRMHHPTIGPLTLQFEKLTLSGHLGLGVVLFWTDAGTADANALDRLRTSQPAAHPTASRPSPDSRR